MNETVLDTVSKVDQTFLLVFGISIFFLLLITICLVFFVIRYHHKKNPEAEQIKGNLIAEIIWFVVPSIIVMVMFYSGWQSFLALRNAPENAMNVFVSARKWAWSFTYENDRTSSVLYVPENKAVRLHITSEDVLHSLSIPAYRIKQDAVPGMTTYAWFKAGDAGGHDIFCTEYCGMGHSAMLARVRTLNEADFKKWYEEGIGTKESRGLEIYLKYGCQGCHSLSSVQGVGPSLQGILGSERRVRSVSEERTLTADEEYLRRSILKPDEDTVIGYPPIMPAFDRKITDEEVSQLLEFISTMSKPE